MSGAGTLRKFHFDFSWKITKMVLLLQSGSSFGDALSWRHTLQKKRIKELETSK